MGQININVYGSFRPATAKTFSALEHGHASAVMQAIMWLQYEVLPNAIKQDAELKSQGHFPRGGFNVKLEWRELPCPACGQVVHAEHGGRSPCPICGVPMVWDDPA